jgi:hypothetical protein
MRVFMFFPETGRVYALGFIYFMQTERFFEKLLIFQKMESELLDCRFRF